jgi:hypothetical protein
MPNTESPCTATQTTAELLQAGNEDTYTVTTTANGWIEIRNNPARQLDPTTKLDFLRLVREDDNYWRVYHLTHNEVLKGEATFSNSFAAVLYSVVADFFATL